MPAEDVERFEAAAGDLLGELGYPRAVPHPRPEALERASRIRGLLARDPRWIDRSKDDSVTEGHKAIGYASQTA